MAQNTVSLLRIELYVSVWIPDAPSGRPRCFPVRPVKTLLHTSPPGAKLKGNLELRQAVSAETNPAAKQARLPQAGILKLLEACAV
jgi:hypothetical protein